MRKLLLSLTICCMIFGSLSISENRISSDHFDIVYEGMSDVYAEIALDASEKSFGMITRALGVTPGELITIILTSDNARFEELTRGALPDWSAAAALPGNMIVLSPLEGHKIELERILAHEIVHSIINAAASGKYVPRWFHEGCAQAFSGRFGLRGRMYLVWKISRDGLLSFADIQRIFSAGPEDAGLAYDLSMLAMNRLMSLHGSSVISDIIEGMRDGTEFVSAFHAATGLWPSEYEQEFLEHMRKKYGHRTLYTLIPGTWTLIMMLAFVVYFVKRHRNKKLLREWDDMDRQGNVINFPPLPPDDDPDY